MLTALWSQVQTAVDLPFLLFPPRVLPTPHTHSAQFTSGLHRLGNQAPFRSHGSQFSGQAHPTRTPWPMAPLSCVLPHAHSWTRVLGWLHPCRTDDSSGDRAWPRSKLAGLRASAEQPKSLSKKSLPGTDLLPRTWARRCPPQPTSHASAWQTEISTRPVKPFSPPRTLISAGSTCPALSGRSPVRVSHAWVD